MSNTSTVFDTSIIKLPKNHSEKGNITSVNSSIEIPFTIRRVYYLYDVPGGESRGGHAHRQLNQLIIAASGSFDISVDDGRIRRTYSLAQPNFALYLPSGLWREISNFSSGSICLVLASKEYDPSDYLRNYEEFKRFKKVYQ